jgi:hypothetical protein
MLDRVAVAWCGRCGSAMAGAARSPRYATMVLRFQWFFFLRNRRGARNSPRGSSIGGELWSRMCGSEAQTLTFGDGGGKLQGTAHDKVGQNGCGVGCRTLTSG